MIAIRLRLPRQLCGFAEVCAVLAFLTLFFLPSLQAAWSRTPETPPVSKIIRTCKLQPPSIIHKEPTLPYLPKYKGVAHFKGAVMLNSKDGKGCSHNLRYDLKESEDKVLEWYRTALQSYGWRFDKYSGNEKNSFVATRREEGLTVVVIVRPSHDKSFRTNLSIRYLDFPHIQAQQKPNESPAKETVDTKQKK